MAQRQSMPMMQNGLIGGMQQQAPKNVLNVGGGAPKAPLQRQTLQYESEPLRGGIGSLGASSVGEQMSSGQFGQMGSGQYGNAPSKSLEQVLAERGFEMPERPTGAMTQEHAMLGKDPVTGQMRFGSGMMGGYYKQLDDMYAQNPEALDIAKQYEADSRSFDDSFNDLIGINPLANELRDEPPQIQTRGPESLAAQGVFEISQPMMQTAGPESFQSALQPALPLESMPTPVTPPPPAPLPTAAPLLPVTPLAASPMQQPQPQMQPPPSPMQQPQYSQQDMQGMMGLMIQMFQKAMQNSGGQSNYNAGSFGGNNMQVQQPQYAPPSPQPMTGRQRFLKNSGNSPFGQY